MLLKAEYNGVCSLRNILTGTRDEEHWFNSVIDRNAQELADITAEYSLDIAIRIAGMLLP